MAEILPIRRKTLPNQSFNELTVFVLAVHIFYSMSSVCMFVTLIRLFVSSSDVQPTGFVHMKYKRFFRVKEMTPELIVPDLKDCQVKTNTFLNKWKFIHIQ